MVRKKEKNTTEFLVVSKTPTILIGSIFTRNPTLDPQDDARFSFIPTYTQPTMFVHKREIDEC